MAVNGPTLNAPVLVAVKAMETGRTFKLNGNVINEGMISNLPADCCAEYPIYVDRTGLHKTFVGNLPSQCAALNMTNVNVQRLTVEAGQGPLVQIETDPRQGPERRERGGEGDERGTVEQEEAGVPEAVASEEEPPIARVPGREGPVAVEVVDGFLAPPGMGHPDERRVGEDGTAGWGQPQLPPQVVPVVQARARHQHLAGGIGREGGCAYGTGRAEPVQLPEERVLAGPLGAGSASGSAQREAHRRRPVLGHRAAVHRNWRTMSVSIRRSCDFTASFSPAEVSLNCAFTCAGTLSGNLATFFFVSRFLIWVMS